MQENAAEIMNNALTVFVYAVPTIELLATVPAAEMTKCAVTEDANAGQ